MPDKEFKIVILKKFSEMQEKSEKPLQRNQKINSKYEQEIYQRDRYLKKQTKLPEMKNSLK